MTAGLRAMVARDPTQAHRASTSLELLFDLVFVVAVSQASGQLHHLWAERHFLAGAIAYAMVFFAIWWAWMNFTWFASAYDTDDWLYRLVTFVQMGGALIVAAGVGPAMVGHYNNSNYDGNHDGNYGSHYNYVVIVIGYVVMRVAMASQWARAAAGDPQRRGTCLRYALGILAVQVLWVLWVVFGAHAALWPVLAVLDLAVPVFAERHGRTVFHRSHIAERYGLFTLIVLGESILAAATSVIGGLERPQARNGLIVVAACSLAIVAAMWWIYFDRPQHDRLTTLRRSLYWGYAHYFIFAAAAAFSAGVEIAVDRYTHDTGGMSPTAAGLTLAAPLAVFVVASWAVLLADRRDVMLDVGVVAIAALLLASPFAAARLQQLPAVVLIAALMVLAAGLFSRRMSFSRRSSSGRSMPRAL